MENSPKCLHCANLRTYDIGYSEYTITGTCFNCAVHFFKEFDDEGMWRNEEVLNLKTLSEKCPHFTEGTPEEYCINCDTYGDEFEKCEDCKRA